MIQGYIFVPIANLVTVSKSLGNQSYYIRLPVNNQNQSNLQYFYSVEEAIIQVEEITIDQYTKSMEVQAPLLCVADYMGATPIQNMVNQHATFAALPNTIVGQTWYLDNRASSYVLIDVGWVEGELQC